MKKISVSKKTFDMLTKLYRIGGFVLVVMALTAFSFILNKLVQFVFMFMSYFMTKGRYKFQWHSKSMKHCLKASIIIFAIAILIVPDGSYSIVISGILGALMSYISYFVGSYIQVEKSYDELRIKYKELEIKYEELNKFKVNGSTPEQLEERCRLIGFKPKAIEFCLRAFTDKFGCYTDCELAEYYCVELQSIKNKKYIYRQKLEK